MKSSVLSTIQWHLAVSILMVGACKHREGPKAPIEISPPQIVDSEKPSAPATPGSRPNAMPAGEVLPLEGLRFAQFSDYDAHDRCAALKDFSDTFLRLHGESVQSSNWKCEQQLLVDEMHYTAQFTLSRDTVQKDLQYYITRGEGTNHLQLSANASSSGNAFRTDLAALSPKLGHWQVTLEAFLKTHNPAPRVFDRPWAEFVDAVIRKIQAEGISIKKGGTAHVVRLTLQPSGPGNRAAGTVRFDEVPEALLVKAEQAEPAAGTVVVGSGGGYLGCFDKACLNDGSVKYMIFEDAFGIQREVPGAGSIRSTVFQSVRFQSFPE